MSNEHYQGYQLAFKLDGRSVDEVVYASSYSLAKDIIMSKYAGSKIQNLGIGGSTLPSQYQLKEEERQRQLAASEKNIKEEQERKKAEKQQQYKKRQQQQFEKRQQQQFEKRQQQQQLELKKKQEQLDQLAKKQEQQQILQEAKIRKQEERLQSLETRSFNIEYEKKAKKLIKEKESYQKLANDLIADKKTLTNDLNFLIKAIRQDITNYSNNANQVQSEIDKINKKIRTHNWQQYIYDSNKLSLIKKIEPLNIEIDFFPKKEKPTVEKKNAFILYFIDMWNNIKITFVKLIQLSALYQIDKHFNDSGVLLTILGWFK